MTERTTPAGMVAALPHMAGYELGDEHIGLVALDAEGRVICGMVADYEAQYAPESTVNVLAERFSDIQGSHAAQIALLVAYGPSGRERLDELASAVHAHADSKTEMASVHVEDSHWSTQTTDGVWTRPQPLPPAPRAAAQDTPSPAAHRSDIDAHYQPLPIPTFQELPARDRAILDRQRPAFRAETAEHTLATLTSSPTAKARATLAHLMDDVQVRDVVIAHASSDPAQRQALIDTYRSAPAQLRGDLATAAAAAMYAAGDQTPRLEAVLSHANPDNSLARIIYQCAENGLDPRVLRSAFDGVHDVIRESDSLWAARRPRQDVDHDRSPGLAL